MASVNIRFFRLEQPLRDDRLLDEQHAVNAVNCRVASGAIEPMNSPVAVYGTSRPGVKTLMHWRYKTLVTWVSWANNVTVVSPSSVSGGENMLLYWTSSDHEPRMTTWADGISGKMPPLPYKAYMVGIPAPADAPAIYTGGTPAVSRSYIYTYRNSLGSESPPSPATVGSGAESSVWTLSGFSAIAVSGGVITSGGDDFVYMTITVSADLVGLSVGDEVDIVVTSGSAGINGRYRVLSIPSVRSFKIKAVGSIYAGTWARAADIYRTGLVTCIYRTTGTDTTYRLVAEITGASYADTVPSASLGRTLPTLDGGTIPATLHSMIVLPNGSGCGLDGNTVCFSEPSLLDSWPVRFRYSVPADCVGLVAVANSIIVVTRDDFHYLITSSTPEMATVAKIEADVMAPCVAAGSIVDIGRGGVYASHDGLYMVDPSGVQPLTAQLYRRREWQALEPTSWEAVVYDRHYMAARSNGAGRSVWVFDLAAQDGAMHWDIAIDALYVDAIDGALYGYQVKNSVPSVVRCNWDSGVLDGTLFTWKSKEYLLPAPVNMGACQVFADFNAVLPVGTGVSVTLRLFADGVQVAIVSVVDDQIFRLPGGYKSERLSIEIVSNVRVRSVHMAETVREIKAV